MTIVDAVKTCLRKYITFSGRASRSEFWKFVLGIVIASIVASIANAVFFGPETEAQFVVRTTQQGTTQALEYNQTYGPGPLTTFLNLAVLLPSIAAASRRMHDTGRSSWYLIVPWAVAILLMATTLLAFRVHVPISEEVRAQLPSLGETMVVPQPPVPLFIVSWLVGVATFILSIVWLARRGQDGPNRYGPDPMAQNT